MGELRSSVVSRLPQPLVKRLRAAKRALVQSWEDETEIVATLAAAGSNADSRVLVDVGAHQGTVTGLFVDLGWSVIAYEPDPSNREKFEQRFGSHPRVALSSSAVSDSPAKSASFFTSPVSTGVSTLAAFHESHEQTTSVDVVTLAEDLRSRGLKNVDFLKIDIEGFDYFALKGFDWTYEPRFVLYEFENRKTVPQGYSLADSAAFVIEHGYHLVYSVWEPIVEYGTHHEWRGLFLQQPSDVSSCWGNVLCFRDADDAIRCMQTFGPKQHRLLGRRRHA
ncbi:FkbM family methyltransferase [Mycobacterium hodleri]|uniref:FkbM family methyltransferase n=1 Tax=Mycolicibacterium hodleri TaxID=49897 RepID=UPI0021F38164|nr:FkbM family methyltransferase [Mycolicibacterium hodleri]MCV7136622.1 FkbM family methyltransferase [Mycolicibacterium hodleri]